MKYLIISLLKSKLLHQHLFTFSQKVTFSLNVNIKFDETTQNPSGSPNVIHFSLNRNQTHRFSTFVLESNALRHSFPVFFSFNV